MLGRRAGFGMLRTVDTVGLGGKSSFGCGSLALRQLTPRCAGSISSRRLALLAMQALPFPLACRSSKCFRYCFLERFRDRKLIGPASAAAGDPSRARCASSRSDSEGHTKGSNDPETHASPKPEPARPSKLSSLVSLAPAMRVLLHFFTGPSPANGSSYAVAAAGSLLLLEFFFLL